MQIDRLGNYVLSLLKARCRVMTLDASTFEYVIPPYIVRPAQVVVQLKYTAPAWPHIIVFASVCRLWNNSVSRAVSGRHMINFRKLQYTAQTRHSEHYWAHQSLSLKCSLWWSVVPFIDHCIVPAFLEKNAFALVFALDD